MPNEEKTHVTIHGGDTWLGQNLPQFEALQAKLEELETRNDALPADFNGRVFLQFMRGSIGEIKRLTAFNHALIEALKEHNKEVEDSEKTITFEEGKIVGA